MSYTKLPATPVPHAELPAYLEKHNETPMVDLFKPYRVFENELRALYAQEPDNEALKDPYINVLPLFAPNMPEIKTRARNLELESAEERSKYIMALPGDKRRQNGSPAVVDSVKQFQHNFAVFSETSLLDLNWDNVVVAGSAVVNCLLPVPREFSRSKRTLREYYHEKLCPASDVDLFLFGLTEEEAIEKIKEIEASVKDSLLSECTTVRTKHAITICSQYPTRHIQIVLRIYKSVSEILTGFDIDSSGAAYDGKQVYCTPRALQSYMTQINHIDLSRRSPSYENRLSKYSHRNFEVYWPDLDRSRIDPTIFERNFRRIPGLARLLVLERLPTSSARDNYLAKRREERGRPALERDFLYGGLRANIKDRHEDEVADWVNEEEVSNYHTFTIPYGVKFHAKKIEKLCYTRDLLLNAEWNQPKDREVYLHRHPAFFGRVTDIIEDCCGFCPTPHTEEELAVHEEESKIYVSGRISFIKDDPGRQQIGSFNPLSDDDWTEMAYVGNTASLCQAIVDLDAERVEDWLAQEGADVNKRDYTGRTPLQLAVTSSTAEIVALLIKAGARLIARLADGRTALHLAAARGDVEIVKMLMDKSNENEAEEELKRDLRRKSAAPTLSEQTEPRPEPEDKDEEEAGDSDGESLELLSDEGSDEDDEAHSMATGSFVKIKRKGGDSDAQDLIPEEKKDDPDIYDVNVIAWDTPCSALHLAIVSGNDEVVKLLCQQYGADMLLPVKYFGHDNKPTAALLTLVMALKLPDEKAKNMVKTLLSLGATSAQADMHGFTCFHQYAEAGATELIDLLKELDRTGVNKSINHVAVFRYSDSTGPLQSAIKNGDTGLVLQLLEAGAAPQIDFETWLKGARQSSDYNLVNASESEKDFRRLTEQPVILAALYGHPLIITELLRHGADVNSISAQSQDLLDPNSYSRTYNSGQTLLDILRKQLETLRSYKGEETLTPEPLPFLGDDKALDGAKPGSWKHLVVTNDIEAARQEHAERVKIYKAYTRQLDVLEGLQEKKAAILNLVQAFEQAESTVVEKGGKTFSELHPDIPAGTRQDFNLWNRADHNKYPPYEFNHGFHPVKDMTPVREAAYVQLFEAAWDGDLETIKRLTLGSWDADQREAPLMISVKDKNHANVFGLAFLRGHLHVAQAILEIAQAQYAPEEATTTKFTMRDPGYDSGGSEKSVDETDEPRIYKLIVDDKFTIDNIGEISMQVKSQIKPLDMLVQVTSPFPVVNDEGKEQRNLLLLLYVIAQNDLNGLSFLLETATQLSERRLDSETEITRFFSCPELIWDRAIEKGRTELLAEIIKTTGAGLPLEDLVKRSGAKMIEKPKSYQGLTVYGKKRKDWATAGRDVMRKTRESNTPPLLTAASCGSIESVEWFLSDTPLRHYLEFANSKGARDDPRLKHLVSTAGGVERVITRWMGNQNDLVMHAAIIGGPKGEKTKKLVQYLIQAYPASMTTKSRDGYTPFYLACLRGRTDVVELLAPHSDQTVKGPHWENILHAVLKGCPTADQLRPMLELFEPELRKAMFKERSSLSAEGRTPLHQWIATATWKMWGASSPQYKTPEDLVAVLKLLLEYSGGEELAMLDGTGDTPLHMLISRQAPLESIKLILEMDANLLFRENAVGRTPAELAYDIFIETRIGTHKSVNDRFHYSNARFNRLDTLIKMRPSFFLPEQQAKFKQRRMQDTSFMYGQTSDDQWRQYQGQRAAEDRERVEGLHQMCLTYPNGKRRLVSLNEANDVARRLGESFQWGRYYSGMPKGHDDDAESEAGQEENKPSEDFVQEKYHLIQSKWWSKDDRY
ncbi:hypothetical protein PpBr36_05142 [Pyricularia pennisetigena]|uniref:hypothetical protein n=1 Tax=Pyricularia pennisetigena TaxID=1578925 RepID=UPI0011521063|nr:hypothetical protein PpBr36_05142 [Pyricularia pennisetigena]TLS27460.1 hypothetical protein PpBr36_05142 [Pyricularia pennisetigena]